MSEEEPFEVLSDNRLSDSSLPQHNNCDEFLRLSIQHKYHDHAGEAPLEKEINFVRGDIIHVNDSLPKKNITTRLPSKEQFPLKLHRLLDIVKNNGFDGIISWQIHGRAFKIHKAIEFSHAIMPFYFRQTKLASFRRQLNIYGFLRITQGNDKGAYYHEYFLRGKYFLAERILRQKLKGTIVKGILCPKSEPDFYSMPYVNVASESSPKEVPSNSEQKKSSAVRITSPQTVPLPSLNMPLQISSDIELMDCSVCNPSMDSDSTEAATKLTKYPMKENILDYFSHDGEDIADALFGGYTSEDFALDCNFCEEVISCLIKELEEPVDLP